MGKDLHNELGAEACDYFSFCYSIFFIVIFPRKNFKKKIKAF
jgi:hypothetical protein